jgi:Tfp pilus assembly protein PilN
MTRSAALKKILSFVSLYLSRLKEIVRLVWRVLTLNPLDEIISPKKTLSVAIGKKAISAAFGTRFFSHCTIKRVKEYPAEDDTGTMQGALDASVPLASGLCCVHAIEAIHDLGAVRSQLTLCIPKSWVIVKMAEFPSTVKENLHDVVSYELDRLTPFSPDEAMYDFRVVKEHNGKISLQIVAAKADVIIPCIEALNEKGIQVERVTFTLSAFGTLCYYGDKKGDVLLVEVDEQGYEGALVIDGVIIRVFTGSFRGTEEGSRVEMLNTEMETLMREAQNQGRSPQVVVYPQDGDSTLWERMKSEFITPARMIDEMNLNLRLREKKKVPYAAVGGVLESLWPKAKGFNLLSKGRHEKSKTPMSLTMILILALMVLGALYFISPLKVEEKRLREIDRQIDLRKEYVRKVESLKKEIEVLKNEVSIINSLKGNNHMTLDILKELTTILPRTSWLTRVRITETTVEIEGYATSATELLPKLEESKYFLKAEFSSPTFRDPRMNTDRFIIKMEIKGAKKTEDEKGREVPKKDRVRKVQA